MTDLRRRHLPRRPPARAFAVAWAVVGIGLAGIFPAAAGAATTHRDKSTTTTERTTTTSTAPQPRTSCQSVAYIGDSTSESLVSDVYIDPSQQLPAQFQRVGVQDVNLQISGARSIVETYEGEPNAYTVAQQLLSQGFHGCWVIAMGTNDAADVAAGSNVLMPERIQRMESLIGNQPVLWINVLSLLSSGYYAESGMAEWDQDLVQACPQYPDMDVYDWASVAQDQPSWFISDDIHYGSAGSAARSADIANALAAAFPATPPGESKHTTASGHSHRAKTTSARSKDSSRGDNGSRRSTTTTTAPRNCVVP